MRGTQQLTRSLLVLAPARARGRWRTPLLAAGLLASAVLAGHVHREAIPWGPATRSAPALPDQRPTQEMLEQARLSLQLSQAHSHELERQIDGLSQRLREAQEELTFFRKARDAKR